MGRRGRQGQKQTRLSEVVWKTGLCGGLPELRGPWEWECKPCRGLIFEVPVGVSRSWGQRGERLGRRWNLGTVQSGCRSKPAAGREPGRRSPERPLVW